MVELLGFGSNPVRADLHQVDLTLHPYFIVLSPTRSPVARPQRSGIFCPNSPLVLVQMWMTVSIMFMLRRVFQGQETNSLWVFTQISKQMLCRRREELVKPCSAGFVGLKHRRLLMSQNVPIPLCWFLQRERVQRKLNFGCTYRFHPDLRIVCVGGGTREDERQPGVRQPPAAAGTKGNACSWIFRSLLCSLLHFTLPCLCLLSPLFSSSLLVHLPSPPAPLVSSLWSC